MDQSGTLSHLPRTTPDEKSEVQRLCTFSKGTHLVSVRAEIQTQILHPPQYHPETKHDVLQSLTARSTWPGQEENMNVCGKG